MHVVLAHNTRIPVSTYGGTERVLWWLGKTLHKQGHKITYLVKAPSHCPFAEVRELKPSHGLNQQIPQDVDLVHFFFQPRQPIDVPYLVTNQGNVPDEEKDHPLDRNTVFVSRNHAARHQATCYVHNGLDPDDYGLPDLKLPRKHLHFLAKTSWRVKNVNDAIAIANRSGERLQVMGGTRFTSRISLKHFLSSKVTFNGMVGGSKKNELINRSKGLLFPVTWEEPFGIAVIESLYFGCPVFATPRGSLPELVPEDMGCLSDSIGDLVSAVQEKHYSIEGCHEYVRSRFTASQMTANYLELYQKVLSGQPLNGEIPNALKTKQEDKVRPLLP